MSHHSSLVILLAALVVLTGWLHGQQQAQQPRYSVPPLLKKLDLMKEQEKKMLDIREQYGPKIDDVRTKLRAMEAKLQEEMEGLLTDEQKKKYELMKLGKDPNDPAKK
jgi:hypothetical protein